MESETLKGLEQEFYTVQDNIFLTGTGRFICHAQKQTFIE